MRTKNLIIIAVAVILGAAGFYFYKNQAAPSYDYTLAEFVQKQQTFSPYTKYEPSFAIDKPHNKIYYVFKAMDDNDIWQIWSASSDLDGKNWLETQQTFSPENKQRPAIVYDAGSGLIYYFYRTGSELGAAEKTTRRLMAAVKNPADEKWKNERELVGNNGIDDTISVAVDSSRRLIILAYTKNQQVTTASLNLDSGRLKETTHTQTQEMNFIPNLAYDENAGLAYVVFPRARAAGTFDNKDLWLASVNYDGSGYQEKRLTDTNYDNTWPFAVLDLARQKIYVSYSFFGAKPTYSAEGIPRVREEIKLGKMNLDGSGWENVSKGLKIFGVDGQTGILYGIFQEPKKDLANNEKAKRYFAVYDPAKDKLKKQFIPSGDEQTYYDMIFQNFDDETKRIFGSQQVCRYEGERGIECQVWTYTGRVLANGEKMSVSPQTSADMAPARYRRLPEFKIISAEAVGNKIKINTNRKLSMPVEFKVTSNGQEVKWEPRQLNQIDQDRGIELRFDKPMPPYEANYKVCALSDPQKPECEEGAVSYAGQNASQAAMSAPGVFDGQDFKITVPDGWAVTNKFPGVLVTIFKTQETFPDEPNVKATDFNSYMMIISELTQGKTVGQLAEEAKNEILKAVANSSVTDSKEGIIDDMPAKFYEFKVFQQNVNFKVLLAVVAKGEKAFLMSSNTTASKWPIYKDILYQMDESFKFKY